MIALKDVAYVRLATSDLARAGNFVENVIGLERSERSGKSLFFRSDDRAFTLSYSEGDRAAEAIGFEVEDDAALNAAAAHIESLGRPVTSGDGAACDERKVRSLIMFDDPSGNHIELVVRPERGGKSFRAARDVAITGFNHVGIFTTDPVRDEAFWTGDCNARVSDRIGDVALMRINAIHHTIALAPASKPGVHHVNHQVTNIDEVMRCCHFMARNKVPLVFGPGRHPTSGSRFLYFKSPDGQVFEYSVGVDEIPDEESYRARQLAADPWSLCTWGALYQG